jgi:glycosyltransferase involved in cell wall biosynthesis
MDKPFITIIIPALNEEKFLPPLLDSLVNQTCRDFEVVVVDGKSKDKTVQAAKNYQDKLPSLQVVVSPKPSLPLQRNLGAKRATGKWLVFCDADSILMPYFMERCINFINTKHPSLFTTWFQPDSDISGDVIFTLFANIAVESLLVFKRPFSPGPLTVVKKDIYELVGGYDEEHAFNEDYDFGSRLAKRGIIVDIMHEALYVWSMRRIRKEGKLKVLQQYFISTLPILLMNKTIKYMPGYVMGGQMYNHKNKLKKTSVLKKYQTSFKKLINEVFEKND